MATTIIESRAELGSHMKYPLATRRYAAPLAALIGTALTLQSYAIPGPPPGTGAGSTLPEVSVIAPRAVTPDELAGASVSNFVTAHARPSPASGQLARWRSPVCVSTLGLTPGFNSFVSERIAAIATSVGAPVGAANCKPDIHIYFTSDPQALATGVAKQLPLLLGYHYVSETKNLAVMRHPIEGWYATATEGDKGGIQLDDPMVLNTEAPGTGAGLLQSKTPPARLGTRLTTGRSSLLVHALLLVDIHKVTGYEIGPIADYLAMLVLSQTRQQDACGQLPSILDLMAPECNRDKPTAVTAGDLAFLRALYASDLRTSYYMEKGSLEGKVLAELAPH